MEHKLNEENIENDFVVYRLSKSICNQINTKTCFFRNPSHQNKYVYFLFRLNFDFGFFIKTKTKQTVYLNNIARKSGCRLHYLKQSAFETHHCWRGLMTSPIISQEKVDFDCIISGSLPFKLTTVGEVL